MSLLKKLKDSYGIEIFYQPSRFQAILKDLLPGKIREINLLMFAMHENIVPELHQVQEFTVNHTLISKIFYQLYNKYGIESQHILWSIQTWGAVFDKKLKEQEEIVEKVKSIPFKCIALQKEPFESVKDYKMRLQSLGFIEIAKGKLMKHLYNPETGLLPVKVVQTNYDNLVKNGKYYCLFLQAEEAKEMFQRSSLYPLYATIINTKSNAKIQVIQLDNAGYRYELSSYFDGISSIRIDSKYNQFIKFLDSYPYITDAIIQTEADRFLEKHLNCKRLIKNLNSYFQSNSYQSEALADLMMQDREHRKIGII